MLTNKWNKNLFLKVIKNFGHASSVLLLQTVTSGGNILNSFVKITVGLRKLF